MALDFIADVSSGGTATAEWANNIRDQGRPAFLTTAARGTAFPSPEDGQQSYLATGDGDEGPWEYHSNGEWRKPWNMPWGFVAEASATSRQNVGTATTDFTDLSVTFSAVANRRYELRARVMLEQYTTAGEVEVILANAANTELDSLAIAKLGATDYFTFTPSAFLDSIGAGSQTFKLRGQTSAGTMDVRNDYTPGRLWVLDVGPDGAPA